MNKKGMTDQAAAVHETGHLMLAEMFLRERLPKMKERADKLTSDFLKTLTPAERKQL